MAENELEARRTNKLATLGSRGTSLDGTQHVDLPRLFRPVISLLYVHGLHERTSRAGFHHARPVFIQC
jgi:hypothetical protein